MLKKIAASAVFTTILLIAVSSTHADLVLVFEGTHDGSSASVTNGVGFGTITLDSFTGAGTPNASYTYTIDGIDAAGDGSANDSLTATFGVTSSVGGNVVFQSDGFFGVSGNGAGNLNHDSESLSFNLLSSSVTLGDTGTSSFNGGGFNRIHFTQFSGDTAVLSGGTSADGNITANTQFSSIDTFTVGHTGNTDSFRVGRARYRFQISASTAVPEPSGLVLFGSAMIGVILRRRRA